MRSYTGWGKREKWQRAGKRGNRKGPGRNQVRGQVLLASKDHECGGR